MLSSADCLSEEREWGCGGGELMVPLSYRLAEKLSEEVVVVVGEWQ